MSDLLERLKESIKKDLSALYSEELTEKTCDLIFEEIRDPDFKNDPLIRVYSPGIVYEFWDEFPEETKLLLYLMACKIYTDVILRGMGSLPGSKKPSIH